MENDWKEFLEFLLDFIEGLPLRKRIRLLRKAAIICGDLADKNALEVQANELEAVDDRAREFRFRFTNQRGRGA